MQPVSHDVLHGDPDHVQDPLAIALPGGLQDQGHGHEGLEWNAAPVVLLSGLHLAQQFHQGRVGAAFVLEAHNYFIALGYHPLRPPSRRLIVSLLRHDGDNFLQPGEPRGYLVRP